jgi:hypothetical protein
MVLESISFLLRRKISILHPHNHFAICNMHTGKKAICILHKNFPQCPSPNGYLVQTHPCHAGDGCAAASAVEAAADGEAMVLDMTAETEAANWAYNNQPKGSDSGRNGGQGNGNGSSCGRGAYNNQPKSGSNSSINGS